MAAADKTPDKSADKPEGKPGGKTSGKTDKSSDKAESQRPATIDRPPDLPADAPPAATVPTPPEVAAATVHHGPAAVHQGPAAVHHGPAAVQHTPPASPSHGGTAHPPHHPVDIPGDKFGDKIVTIDEHVAKSWPGAQAVVAVVVLVLLALAIGAFALIKPSVWALIPAVILVLVALAILVGLYTVEPNQAAALTYFGAYRGTDRTAGLRFANPLYVKTKVSLRVRNFTTAKSKVNDARGNPIEIAAVVVWRVNDTARALYGVNHYEEYVHIQSESAVRHIARSYPYDAYGHHEETTLIGDTTVVAADLLDELQERAADAGVQVIEARITDLSYAPEIAEAMLRRQQAEAIVAARAKIVEGAVLMVREAIRQLADSDDPGVAVPFDSERRAAFASNLMTVIVSDSPSTPVVNVGSVDR